MTILLSEYKDVLNQDIQEGSLCLFCFDKHTIKFGVVTEVRKKVKVAFTYEQTAWQGGSYVVTNYNVVGEKWVDSTAVSVVNEDWLYDLLPTDTLISMATIRGQKMEDIEKIKAKKERKKLREGVK
jgi:hypothetical protein